MTDIQRYTDHNPFIAFRPKYPRLEILKCILMTPVALVRFVLILCIMILVCILCKFLIIGADLDKPFSLFRNILLYKVRFLLRVVLFIAGFYWIPVTNLRRDNNICNIIVANHCSMFDHFKLAVDLGCSGASKIENFKISLFSAILKAMHCVSIDRSTPESRKNAMTELNKRATRDDLPPLVVFPQGTTANNSYLTSFKIGAFTPGVSVQPVCIIYSYTQMDPYLGFRSLGYYIYWSLCQFINYVQYVYLPVYVPTEEEKKNPELFANNVRKYMAEYMLKYKDVKITNHSYDDSKLFQKAKKLNILIDFTVQDVKNTLNLNTDQIIENLESFKNSNSENITFREYLNKKKI
jgi:lysophosphatidylcholine acyltransferase/lyso-PAF acetyltransferase